MLGQDASAGAKRELLTNAADVISLPVERAARQLKVLVTGTVTVTVPTLGGSFFVQDATCGVFVDNRNGPRRKPGDVVRVSGVTEKGAYAPVITGPTVVKIGTAPLPPARAVSIEASCRARRTASGWRIPGIVRAAQISETESNLDLAIASAGYRFHAFPKMSLGIDPQRLIGARVRLRGDLRRFLQPGAAALDGLEIVHDITCRRTSWWKLQSPSIPSPSRCWHSIISPNIAKTKGRASASMSRARSLIKDPARSCSSRINPAGCAWRARQIEAVSVGDVIEAAGFADIENFLPVLQDAVVSENIRTQGGLMPAKAVTLQQVQDGLCHAALITLQGKLLDGFVRRDHQPSGAENQGPNGLDDAK